VYNVALFTGKTRKERWEHELHRNDL
jgi:hypothetical protein